MSFVRTGLLRRGRQGAALLLLGLWAVAQLGGQLHRLEQPHAVCAEHGELVHAGLPDGVAAPPGKVAEAPGAAVQAAPAAGGALADSHHDHCSVGAPLGPEPPAVNAAVGPPARAVCSGPVRLRSADLSLPAIFVVAPKTSPPAA